MLIWQTNLVIASGTCPANAGKTGVIPRSLILFRIWCWRASWFACHDGVSGPPQPWILPMRTLVDHRMKGQWFYNCTWSYYLTVKGVVLWYCLPIQTMHGIGILHRAWSVDGTCCYCVFCSWCTTERTEYMQWSLAGRIYRQNICP